MKKAAFASSIAQREKREKKKRNIFPIMRILIKEIYKKINIIDIRNKSSAKGDKNYEITQNRGTGKDLWRKPGKPGKI